MEEDDEFGDLYTDVLRPLTASLQAQQPPHPEERQPDASKAAAFTTTSSRDRPIDLNINSDDEEILYGTHPNSNSNSNLQTPSIILQEKTLAPKSEKELHPTPKSSDLDRNLDREVGKGKGLAEGNESDTGGKVLEKSQDVILPERTFRNSNFLDEANIDVVVEERDEKDDDLVQKDENLAGRSESTENLTGKHENIQNLTGQNEKIESFEAEDGNSEPMIPGLSIPGVSGGADNRRDVNFEDEWDSDSEDDLQIVLNDNNHGLMGMERMGGEEDDEDDEDGDPLVIVADNIDSSHPPMLEEQEWGEEAGAGGDGERKELGDPTKGNGGVPVAPKIGYSNHVYHHPFHSQFKYVRPGAAPMPGAPPVGPGGAPGQVRPPLNVGAIAGRGRGDWRPPGMKGATPMQKGFHPGYGMPVWGSGASGRGFGIGLEFTLPSHKTIFEVDIDSFEEKPWKLPGIDISDFFNFGLNEETWKDYCKQLEQLRLESSMQGKIRVYESGRTEQEYDPDLPPELAAAAGIQDIQENSNAGKTDAGQIDLSRGAVRVRPPLPTGRPIQVECGSGDRLPSIDTRQPRIRDSDAIIEIVCQDSADDGSYPGNEVREQPEQLCSREDLKGTEDTEDIPEEDIEHYNRHPHGYKGQKREAGGRKHEYTNSNHDNTAGGVGALPYSSETPAEYHDERRAKGRACERSPSVTASGSTRDKQHENQKEESIESVDGKHSQLSSPAVDGTPVEQDVEHRGSMDDDFVPTDSDLEIKRGEVALNVRTKIKNLEDDDVHLAKKQKTSSQIEEPSSHEIDGGEDSKAARSSENSKARSGSSKDYRKLRDGIEEEVVQDGRSNRMGNVKRMVGGDEYSIRRKGRDERPEGERYRVAAKGRDDSYSHKSWDPNSAPHSRMRTEGIDRRKESDNSEGAWQRGDDDLHWRRIKVEDARKREHDDEVGSRHRAKVREIERSEKDDHHQSRKQLDNGSWRASHEKDMVVRHRDREDSFKSRSENMDDRHSRRRKEEAPIKRERAEKEEMVYAHRESISHRKRERTDVSDQRKRDDQTRSRDDDLHYIRPKEENLFQRERIDRQSDRDEWQRPRQSHEGVLLKREREEVRSGMRSGRVADDKTWVSHSRGKDEYKASDREYHAKDVGRHSEQVKRRDRDEIDTLSQKRRREEVYGRGDHLGNDERRIRHERTSTRDDRAANASDGSRLHEKKHKENTRKPKESEGGDRSSSTPSKANQDEHSGQINEAISLKGKVEQRSNENEVHVNHQSSRKHGEDASDDDEQPDSRRGRSKMERWTSHKERDFSINKSSSLKIKEIDMLYHSGATLASKVPDEPSKRTEDNQQPSANEKNAGGLEMNNVDAKIMQERHLETVEKLKKRSERFKLPMPSEKEAIAVKKVESEPLSSTQSESQPDAEIKPERPARRRRWTGN